MKLKYDFLNWQPDAEDYKNAGLTTAENIIHSEEGYLPYKTPTASAFSTTAALATTPSMVVKSIGTNNQRVVAYIDNVTAAGAGYTVDFNVGLLSSGYTTIANYTTVTSSTVSSVTVNRVIAFDACELGGYIFFAAQAECQTATVLNAAAPVITLNVTGYATI